MQLFLFVACIGLYASSTALVSGRLFHVEGPKVKLALYAASGGLVSHTLIILNNLTSEAGQNLSITNVAAIVAALITFIILFMSVKNRQTFLLPLVTGFSALVVLTLALAPATGALQVNMNPGLFTHIGLALLAYGCLCIAFLYSLQLGFINRKLKEKKAVILHSSLPPLMLVEQNLFRLLVLGTLLLTLSLVSGFFFLEDMFAQRQVHKTLLTLIAWGMYTGSLLYHRKYGMKDNTIITFSTIGVILLTLAYFGSRIVKEVLLSQ